MDPDAFARSTDADAPPDGLGPAIEALWWDRKGDWHRAHELCQSAASRDGDRIHAYLHRKEGDLSNAGYWYARADAAPATGPLDDEWHALTEELLGRSR